MASAGPIVLEPLMRVEVRTPSESLGDVMADLSRRRGIILAQEARGARRVLEAEVPLAKMFGYVGDLRSLTHGRADFTMVFERFAKVK